MLQITIPGDEFWDEEKQEFVQATKDQILQLEHSLVSLSNSLLWTDFMIFLQEEKTTEETIDYIKCMTLTKNVNPDVYDRLTKENLQAIDEYIQDPMTGTTFSDNSKNTKGKLNGEIITTELVYYWMIAMQIPFECRKWHFNRLLTLIRVCEIKNQPPKKTSKKDIMSRNAALNAARRKQLNTKG